MGGGSKSDMGLIKLVEVYLSLYSKGVKEAGHLFESLWYAIVINSAHFNQSGSGRYRFSWSKIKA